MSLRIGCYFIRLRLRRCKTEAKSHPVLPKKQGSEGKELLPPPVGGCSSGGAARRWAAALRTPARLGGLGEEKNKIGQRPPQEDDFSSRIFLDFLCLFFGGGIFSLSICLRHTKMSQTYSTMRAVRQDSQLHTRFQNCCGKI